MKFYVKIGVHTGTEAPKEYPEIPTDWGAIGFNCPKNVKNVKIG
jgi:hypothetical protein